MDTTYEIESIEQESPSNGGWNGDAEQVMRTQAIETRACALRCTRKARQYYLAASILSIFVTVLTGGASLQALIELAAGGGQERSAQITIAIFALLAMTANVTKETLKLQERHSGLRQCANAYLEVARWIDIQLALPIARRMACADSLSFVSDRINNITHEEPEIFCE